MSDTRVIKVREQKPGECCRMYGVPVRLPPETALTLARMHFGDDAVLVHIPDVTIHVYAVERVPQVGVAMKDETPGVPPHA